MFTCLLLIVYMFICLLFIVYMFVVYMFIVYMFVVNIFIVYTFVVTCLLLHIYRNLKLILRLFDAKSKLCLVCWSLLNCFLGGRTDMFFLGSGGLPTLLHGSQDQNQSNNLLYRDSLLVRMTLFKMQFSACHISLLHVKDI